MWSRCRMGASQYVSRQVWSRSPISWARQASNERRVGSPPTIGPDPVDNPFGAVKRRRHTSSVGHGKPLCKQDRRNQSTETQARLSIASFLDHPLVLHGRSVHKIKRQNQGLPRRSSSRARRRLSRRRRQLQIHPDLGIPASDQHGGTELTRPHQDQEAGTTQLGAQDQSLADGG